MLALATNYSVQVGSSLKTLIPVTCLDQSLDTCLIKDMISGNTYYVWVNGYNTTGQGVFATAKITLPAYTPPPPFVYTPPPPPILVFPGGAPATGLQFPLSSPKITGVGADGTVNITWAALTDPNRTGYEVDYSLDGQTWIAGQTLPTTATAITVSKLSNGIATLFRLVPSGPAGKGVSSTATVTPGKSAAAPVSLTAQAGNAQVNLSWQAPADSGGLPIQNYVIEQSTDGTNWTLASSVGGDKTEVNIPGLKNYTTYTFRVSAVTNYGKGTSATLSASASTLPSAPLGLKILSTGDKNLQIGWALPTDATAGSITSFKIELSPDGQSWTSLPSVSGTTTTDAITGLNNGSTYEVRVTPVSTNGTGASSVILGAPGTPPSVVSAVATASGDKKITLSFTAPTNNGGFSVDYYAVETAPSANGPWTTTIPNSGSSITHLDVTNLKNGTLYFFKVFAVNQIGTSNGSSVVSGVPQPPIVAPTIKSFIMAPTSVKIVWVAPTGPTTKSGVKQYLIETSVDGLLWTAIKNPLPAATQSYVITRLVGPQLLRIRAVNGNGPGVPTLGIRIPGTSIGTSVIVPGPKKPFKTPVKTPKHP